MDRSTEPSVFGPVFAGVVGAVALGGILWSAVRGRRRPPVLSADDHTWSPDGHPS